MDGMDGEKWRVKEEVAWTQGGGVHGSSRGSSIAVVLQTRSEHCMPFAPAASIMRAAARPGTMQKPEPASWAEVKPCTARQKR